MTEILYLVVQRGRWDPRIHMVTKRKPLLPRPSEQAIVKLEIRLPDRIMDPPHVTVQINEEHIAKPTILVTAKMPN
jgi:hypothetical protein